MKDERHRLLARVHIAKNSLGLDGPTYRAVIDHGWGVDSAARLGLRELRELAGKLETQVRAREFPGRPRNIGPAVPDEPARSRMLRKIEALLADKGRVQGAPVSWAYADTIARRTWGVEKVAWCSAAQLRAVIGALEKDARRMAARAANDG